MSHLTPHRSVRITAGGAAADTPVLLGVPAPPDTSWHGMIADLANALGLTATAAEDFATRVDSVVDALGGDREVARTKVRAALLGNTGMLDDQHALGIAPAHVDHLLDVWEQDPSDESSRVLARLALMHEAVASDPGDPATVGEGSGGSAATLPENVVGQVAYTLDDVPRNAKDVVIWIGEATDEDDRRARAQAAQEIETDRESGARKTVAEAIAGVLDG